MKDQKKEKSQKDSPRPKRDIEYLRKNFKGLRKIDLKSSDIAKEAFVKFAFSY